MMSSISVKLQEQDQGTPVEHIATRERDISLVENGLDPRVSHLIILTRVGVMHS